MTITGIILLGIIILLLIVLVRKIDILDKKAIRYVRVYRISADFEATKNRFKELGYEICEVKEMGDGFLGITFVKVK